MNDKSEVIILSNNDYRDADAILHVLDKQRGKLAFVARGVRKTKSKNANNCNLFNLSTFYYNYQEQREMQSLKTAEAKLGFRNIREDLIKQSIASVMVEMIDKINVEEPATTFTLLKFSLLQLDTSENPFSIFGLFIARICEMCGITPYVDGCVQCNRTDTIAAISLLDGGFVCQSCFDAQKHVKRDKTILKFFRLFNKATLENFSLLEKITPCTYRDVEDLLMFFNEYSGVRLQSLKFLEHIVGLNEKQ